MTNEMKAPTPKKRRSALSRQRRAVAISLAVVILLGAALGVVTFITRRSTFRDPVDDAKYVIVQKGDGYVMQDADGNPLPTTEEGNFKTAAGTVVMVNSEGKASVIAVVDIEGTETLKFDSYYGQYDVLMYPLLERADIAGIKVVNENGTFSFSRDSEDNVILTDHPKTGIDNTMFATLVVCTGYTRTLQRLALYDENGNKTAGFAENGYGEYGLPEDPADAESYFVITAKSGVSHTVIVGDRIPSGNGYYVRYMGRDQVYILKELDESESNATFSQAILGKVEDYVTPMATYPAASNNFFDVTDFEISLAPTIAGGTATGDQFRSVVEFSFVPIEERKGTYAANTPYVAQGRLDGFSVNSSQAYTSLQTLSNMVALRTVWLSTKANPIDEMKFAEEYGVAYTLEYVLNLARNQNDYSVADEDKVYHQVWISPKTEDDTYYLYNEGYGMVIEVEAIYLEFLDWSAFDWIETEVLSANIAFCKKIEIFTKTPTVKGLNGLTHVSFVLDNSKSSKEEDPTNSSDISIIADYTVNGETHTGIAVNVAQFRLFYQTLLRSNYSGNAAISEEQQDAYRAKGDDADVVIRLTFDVNGKDVTYVYRCHNYSARQTYMTKNNNGSFYILQSRVEKIVNDLGRVFSTDVIDPAGRD